MPNLIENLNLLLNFDFASLSKISIDIFYHLLHDIIHL